MKVSTKETKKGWRNLTCAFCHGTGKDPFGLLSSLSACSVCMGEGTVTIKTPYVRCAHCRGTGAEPHTRLTCAACEGKGVQPIIEPTQPCPLCGGTGTLPESEIGLSCPLCDGSGVIHTAA